MSTRIRIIGGVWPERIGAEGVTVADPGDGIYPFDRPRRGELVVLLDDDPLIAHKGDFTGWEDPPRWWTCVVGVGDVEVLP